MVGGVNSLLAYLTVPSINILKKSTTTTIFHFVRNRYREEKCNYWNLY